MKKKCKSVGCYDPEDCRHGYCAKHCPKHHKIAEYSVRAYPTSNLPHIGVEIEVEFDSHTDLKRAIPLKATHDGSLNEYGAEYKVLAPAKKICAKTAKLLEELWIRRAKVTRRCGLHVHIDVRNVHNVRLQKVFRWLKHTESEWFNLMPTSRRPSNTEYLKVLPNKLYGPVEVPSFSCPTEHYIWIHKTPYSTLECRLHGGTLNPHKVGGWLEVMIYLQQRIQDNKYEFSIAKNPKEAFWEVFKDSNTIAKEYLQARMINNGVIKDYAYDSLSVEAEN